MSHTFIPTKACRAWRTGGAQAEHRRSTGTARADRTGSNWIELDRTGSNCWQPCSLLSLFLRVFLLLFLRVCACTALLSSLSVSACVSASVSACVCVYKAYTEACACMLLLVSAMLDACVAPCVCVCVYSTKCVESAVGTGFCGAFLACLTAAGQPHFTFNSFFSLHRDSRPFTFNSFCSLHRDSSESGRVAAWQEAPCASAWPTHARKARLAPV